jgi:hypothetical protein
MKITIDRSTVEQALEVLTKIRCDALHEQDCNVCNTEEALKAALARHALRAALEEPCPCGDRPAAQCPGEWEPGCDLGNNPKYARRVNLAEPQEPSSIRELLTQAAAMAVAAERAGRYEGASWVADAVLETAPPQRPAEPVLNPAPGYCKHCKQYTIEEPLPAEPVQEPVATMTVREDMGVDFKFHRPHTLRPGQQFHLCLDRRPAEPVQEPFGYLWPTGRHPEFRFTQQKRDGVDGMPLYTSPPQRPAEPTV